MNKYLIILLSCLTTTACGSDNTSHYVDNKVLMDREGCAFIARRNIGDNLFLYFSKELSKETCQYVEK